MMVVPVTEYEYNKVNITRGTVGLLMVIISNRNVAET